MIIRRLPRIGAVVLFAVCYLLITLFPTFVMAQGFGFSNLSVAISIVSKDESIVEGDILGRTEAGGVIRTTTDFDPSMIGVYYSNATIVYHSGNGGIPVAIQGFVPVNVTTLGGNIEPGNYITSSNISGKGKKAAAARGQVLGIATTGLNESNGTPIEFEGAQIQAGTVFVNINIRAGDLESAGLATNIVDQLGLLLLRNVETPERGETFFRFIIAGLVAAVAIIVSFVTFGRNITRGLEAIGRNPLARAQIQAMIVVNILLIAAVSIGAIILSLAIIRS